MVTRVLGSMAGLTAVVCLLAGCVDERPGQGSCSDREEQRVTLLSKLPILDARPPSTEAAGAYAGCGVDDSGDPVASHVGRRYRSALAEPEVRTFYWDELMRDGWRNAATVIAPEVAPSLAFQRGISCLVKDVAGIQVVFTVSVDPSPDSSSSPLPLAYAIQVADQNVDSLSSPC
jgi:hypothetical protein